MSDESVILRTEALSKVYRQGETELHVLKEVTLEVRRGEILAILGPSGAGKSTLLHLLGFLDRPTSGDVFFERWSLSRLGSSEQSRVRNLNFGFVFQMYHLLPELNALENVLLPLMIRHEVPSWIRESRGARARVKDLLQRLGLGARLTHLPSELSGGEQQRVALARALAGDPQVVLCDEPTGNLDRATGQGIRDLITNLNRDTGKTFVLVTHDPDTAAIAHRRIEMVDGVLQSG